MAARIVTLHEQKGMPLIRSHIKMLENVLYRKPVTSENCQIQEKEQYDPIGDKHLRPLPLPPRLSAQYVNRKEYVRKQLAEIGHYHYLNPHIFLEPLTPEQT
jgi:hypothetical protein